jgi:hypothetical protein
MDTRCRGGPQGTILLLLAHRLPRPYPPLPHNGDGVRTAIDIKLTRTSWCVFVQLCTPENFDLIDRAVKCTDTRPSQDHFKHALQLGTVPVGWQHALAVLTVSNAGVGYETFNAAVDYPKLRANERQRHSNKRDAGGGRDVKRGSGGGGGGGGSGAGGSGNKHKPRGGRGRQGGGGGGGGGAGQ